MSATQWSASTGASEHAPPPPTTENENAGSGGVSDSGQPPVAPQFVYGSRFSYLAAWRHFQFEDFLTCDRDQVLTVAHTFKHHNGTRVTLVPLMHVAHPEFWRQVDSVCMQHDSVLMEGRHANLLTQTTMVPPRAAIGNPRPPENEDDEGWEPLDAEGFFQPYSWGVKDSPNNTVIHAADKYDYEKLPPWASARFSWTLFGTFQREKACLDLMPVLAENGYQTFCIPWGAAHMPIFASVLEKNGFELISTGRLVVFNRVDGITSEGWVKKMNTKMFWRSWGRTFARSVPLLLPIPFMRSYVMNEVPFFGTQSHGEVVDFSIKGAVPYHRVDADEKRAQM